MAKKSQEPKIKPRRGEAWEDSSKDPVEVYHIGPYYQRGSAAKDRGFTCEIISEDKQGNNKTRTEDVPLIAFGAPGMQMVDDSKASDDEAAPAARPSVMVKPIKNGIALICPGQSCGDKHEIVLQVVAFDECIKQLREAHARFLERHEPHMLDGTLFAGQS